ncbi:MAG TPA: hypothetical protein VNI52_12370 [Sphingobacteriaceae bacterium]|nr:hypothetical protein [Sphingobacteriaceae bacterium]
MTAKQFVIESINKIVANFMFVQCRYQFDEFSDTHYVEVMPKGYMESPNAITDVQNAILLDFINRYPNQLLAFFSDDDLIQLDRVDYENRGICYNSGATAVSKIENAEVLLENAPNTVIAGENFALAA